MRTFLAIDLPASFRDEISDYITDLRAQYTKSINWVKPENLHFTLQFIGNIHNHHLEQISNFIQEKLEHKQPILLSNPKLALIPGKAPRLLWIEMETEQNWVQHFCKDLRHFLQELGYEKDKKKLNFHITLGRIKGKLPDYFVDYVLRKQINRISLKLNTITLYESKLQPEGPIYNAISKFILEDTDEKR